MRNFSKPTDTRSWVVDENAAAFKRLGQNFKGHVVVGTGIDYDVLKRAGAATADGFIAVTNGDNRNIMAALIAQRMFKIKRIVARIYDPPRGQMYRELGVQTVCPTTVGAKMIRDVLIEAPWENAELRFGQPHLARRGRRRRRCRQTRLGDRAGRRVRIAAVRRGPRDVLVASADLVLQEGDEINAVVAPDASATSRSASAARRRSRKRWPNACSSSSSEAARSARTSRAR